MVLVPSVLVTGIASFAYAAGAGEYDSVRLAYQRHVGMPVQAYAWVEPECIAFQL